ncbi:MAG: enoyl-CoA hydratase/isomerase family protein [Candidatus Tectomicrobia bacterium]|nr:enoyl-CoA hydratase/isomerase family protein [Candidatus Tectomicrobia bacterium]
MSKDFFLVHREEYVATLTINRPEVRNAVSQAMWEDLPGRMKALDEDPQVRVVVIRGAGESAFASGADISEFESTMSTPDGAMRQNEVYEMALESVEAISKPVIAMIHGFALGGGCGLATVCDLRIAADTLRMGVPAGRLGVVYSVSSTRRLVNLVGPSCAKELLMTARTVGAEEALRIGLVNHVLPAPGLAPFTYELAKRIAENAPLTVRGAKLAVRVAVGGGSEEDEREIHELRIRGFLSEDFKEGVRAFLEKRPARFAGK